MGQFYSAPLPASLSNRAYKAGRCISPGTWKRACPVCFYLSPCGIIPHAEPGDNNAKLSPFDNGNLSTSPASEYQLAA